MSARSLTRPEPAFSPRVLVGERVFTPDFPGTASDRLVALAIGFMLGTADDGQGYVAFPSVATIASRAGLSRATVTRSLRALTSGPAPLFERHTRAPWKRNGRPIPPRVAAVRLVLDPVAYRAEHPERPRRQRPPKADAPAPAPAAIAGPAALPALEAPETTPPTPAPASPPPAFRIVPTWKAMAAPAPPNRTREAVALQVALQDGRISQSQYDELESRLRSAS